MNPSFCSMCSFAVNLLLLFIVTTGASGGERSAESILKSYQLGEKFGSGEMDNLVRNASVAPHWMAGGSRFWYRNQTEAGRRFILVDAEKGKRKAAFNHAKVARQLGRATGKEIAPDQLPFDRIALAENGKSFLFQVEQQVWRVSMRKSRCQKTTETLEVAPAAAPDRAGRRGLSARSSSSRSGVSPDGKWSVTVKDYNLILRETAGGKEQALTTDGREGYAYASPRWAPDSQSIVAWRTKAGDNLKMYTVESMPKDGVRPVLHSITYPLPGDKLDAHEPWVFRVGDAKGMKLDTEPVAWGDVPYVQWRDGGKRFLYFQTHRGFQQVRILEGDVLTSQTRTVVDEKSRTFVDPFKTEMRYTEDMSELIWGSERDGWQHLYLYDIATGKVKNQITQGEWIVRDIVRVDEDLRQIIFIGSGKEEGQDPYYKHYYRVNFDGTGLTRLTEGDGSHSVQFSPDRLYLLDTYSRVDMPSVTTLRRVSDGSLIVELEKADAADLLATGWKLPEPFCAKGRDGKTDIFGVIYRPVNLNQMRKYPVIEYIYAGPHDAYVQKEFRGRSALAGLAQLGFIVVQIDGMGTSQRSKAFQDVAYKNLADGGFPDRIKWMQAAAERYPYMDLSHVGIYGHSAGGYNSTHALLSHPEFYKVAVSSSGNHDHRTDKVTWNEIWMGYPVGKHYAEQSNVTNAYKLQGKLLLIHGELDTNVNPSAGTLQMVDALIKANKDFDMLIVPGQEHGCMYHPYVKRRRWDYFVQHLRGEQPPIGFQLGK